MGFMAGFAEVIVDQYNKGVEHNKEKEKQELQSKLNIAETEATLYTKKKMEQQEYLEKAEVLAKTYAGTTDPNIVKGIADQLKAGMDPAKAPQWIKVRKNSPTAVTDSALPPGVQTVSPDTSAIEDPAVPENVPVPGEIPEGVRPVDQMKVSQSTPAVEQNIEENTEEAPPAEEGIRQAGKTEQVTRETTRKVPESDPRELTSQDGTLTVRFGGDTEFDAKDVGTYAQEAVKLEQMKMSGASEADIWRQQVVVETLNDIQMRENLDKKAAEYRTFVSIDPDTGRIVSTRQIRDADVRRAQEEGVQPGDSLGNKVPLTSKSGKPLQMVEISPEEAKNIITVKEKFFKPSQDLLTRGQAIADGVRLLEDMNTMAADPANTGMGTLTADGVGALVNANTELKAIETFFNSYSMYGQSNKSPEALQKMYEDAQNAMTVLDTAIGSNWLQDEASRIAANNAKWEVMKVSMAYKLASANKQEGRDVAAAEFDRFYKMASTPGDITKGMNALNEEMARQYYSYNTQSTNLQTSIDRYQSAIIPGGMSVDFGPLTMQELIGQDAGDLKMLKYLEDVKRGREEAIKTVFGNIKPREAATAPADTTQTPTSDAETKATRAGISLRQWNSLEVYNSVEEGIAAAKQKGVDRFVFKLPDGTVKQISKPTK